MADIIEATEAADRELTAELVELRRELVELWPETDDSRVKPPSLSESPAAKLQARLRYQSSLAYFDKWTESEPQPFNADGEGGLAKRLLGILQSKDTAYLHEREAAAADETAKDVSNPDDVAADTHALEAEQDGPGDDVLNGWRRRLGNVQRRYDYAVRLFRLRARTSAGLALVKLEAVPDRLNPPARLLDEKMARTTSVP